MSKIGRKIGQVASQTPDARQRRAETQRKRQRAANEWNPTTLPVWLTDQVFDNDIQPKLAKLATASIASCLEVHWTWASRIQRGIKRPHRRHWLALAQLTGVSR